MAIIDIIKDVHSDMQAYVSMGSSNYIGLKVSNGVKEVCVLAPTLSSLYLSAALKTAFRDCDRGVYIQTRPDAHCVSPNVSPHYVAPLCAANVAHFRAKTKTTQDLMRKLPAG